PSWLVAVVEAYAKEQGRWHDESSPDPVFSESLELDLGSVVPSLAGPSRPQDRVPLDRAKELFRMALAESLPPIVAGSPDQASANSFPASDPPSAADGITGKGSPDPSAGPTPAGTGG